MRRQDWLPAANRGTEWLLWVIAALCLGVVGFAGLTSLRAQHTAEGLHAEPAPASASSAASHGGPSTPSGSTLAPAPVVTHAGDVIGRLEIPALGLSVPMTAGIETSSLLRGVGHIDGTALPGGLGTLGLAGHRDTYFRPLRNIGRGMEINVIDRTGTYHYFVDSTEIVLPEQVEVLAIQSQPEMTLVTCYPFDYVGAAPKRFIVHAHLQSAAPDEQK